jgi:hypothetical protein
MGGKGGRGSGGAGGHSIALAFTGKAPAARGAGGLRTGALEVIERRGMR